MTLLCTYTYDPLDRIATQGTGAQALTQRFYCDRQMISEQQGSLQRTLLQAGGRLLAQRNREGDAESVDLIVTDQQNSALNVPASAQKTDLAYSPYGHRKADLSGTELSGFTGAQPERVTGHYLLGNGYRAFNPTLMRFNSPDGLSPFGKGGLNAYAYCVGDPINRTDPTGQMSFLSFGAIAGLILSTAGIGSAVVSGLTSESNPELSTPLMIAGIAVAVLGVGVAGGSVSAALAKRAAAKPPPPPVGRQARGPAVVGGTTPGRRNGPVPRGAPPRPRRNAVVFPDSPRNVWGRPVSSDGPVSSAPFEFQLPRATSDQASPLVYDQSPPPPYGEFAPPSYQDLFPGQGNSLPSATQQIRTSTSNVSETTV